VRAAALVLGLLVFSGTSNADEQVRSIYDINPEVDVPVLVVSGLGATLPKAYESHLITPSCPCDPGAVNFFDRPAIGNSSQAAATASDVTLGLAIVVPPLVDYLALGASKPFLEDAVVFTQVILVNESFANLAKFSVQRPIPLAYSSQDPAILKSPSSYQSFYSGHVSLTFATLMATASTLEHRAHLGPWPWIGAAVIGGSVAYERVAAGRHFPSDVFMASFAGSVDGLLVPYLHFRKDGLYAITERERMGLGWRLAF
jgi:membrane-associated phospholipid phosphatase